jgi:hypothetical protein
MFVSEDEYELARTRRGWINDYSSVRAEIASIAAEISAMAHPTMATWNDATSSDFSAHQCHGHTGHDCGPSGHWKHRFPRYSIQPAQRMCRDLTHSGRQKVGFDPPVQRARRFINSHG